MPASHWPGRGGQQLNLCLGPPELCWRADALVGLGWRIPSGDPRFPRATTSREIMPSPCPTGRRSVARHGELVRHVYLARPVTWLG